LALCIQSSARPQVGLTSLDGGEELLARVKRSPKKSARKNGRRKDIYKMTDADFYNYYQLRALFG
jgi:hypothetical protein